MTSLNGALTLEEVNEVSVGVSAPGLHKGKVAMQGLFKKIRTTCELAFLTSLGSASAYPCRSLEGGNPCTGSAHSLSKSALRTKLDVKFASQELPLELLVLTYVRTDHLLHLAGL